jgi:hypothetical protein
MGRLAKIVGTSLGLAGAVSLVIGSSGQGALANAGGVPAIPLNNEQETTGATGGGSGFFTYTITGSTLCYTLEVSNLTMAPFAAHIHPARRNVAGPVAVGLLTPPAATSTVSACITAVAGATGAALSTAELAAIAADPRAFYVNVHTTTFPGGEVRGQLK